MLRFTTSWDDGHVLDLRTAKLLEEYGFTGTFYLCRTPKAGGTLSVKQIRSIAAKHEIGAHTLTHPSLLKLGDAELKKEIEGSKAWIEDVTGKPCTMFAYPYGEYDDRIVAAVKKAGFLGARTTEDLTWRTGDPFRLTPTLAVQPFPFHPVWNTGFIRPYMTLRPKLKELGVSHLQSRTLRKMTGAVLRKTARTAKPWFHLRGHSLSLETYGLWDQFEAMLKEISETPFLALQIPIPLQASR